MDGSVNVSYDLECSPSIAPWQYEPEPLRRIVKITLLALATILLLALAVVVVGWRLPVKHRTSRQASYTAAPEAVYTTITTPQNFPAWRSSVKAVEMAAAHEGRPSYREIGGDGTILYVVEEEVPSQRLVTRIADRSLPFGGTWTYELSPAGSGTVLRITEDGEVYNIFFRAMSKYVFGHDATIDRYLRDLGKRLGHDVAITAVD
jgi:uncharacterized protein YndB with AHSA1/START domain